MEETTEKTARRKEKDEKEKEDEEGREEEEVEPIIVLSSCLVSIEKLDIQCGEVGGGLAWLYNLLVTLAASTIKDGVVAKLTDVLMDHMSDLLGMLNEAVRCAPSLPRFLPPLVVSTLLIL